MTWKTYKPAFWDSDSVNSDCGQRSWNLAGRQFIWYCTYMGQSLSSSAWKHRLSDFSMRQNSYGLLKQAAGVCSQGFWLISLDGGPKIRIPDKFPGNAEATGPGSTLWEPLLYGMEVNKASLALCGESREPAAVWVVSPLETDWGALSGSCDIKSLAVHRIPGDILETCSILFSPNFIWISKNKY